jgi:PASTA domain
VSSDPTKFLSDVFAIRLGDAIASVGEGVASAQLALDQASIETTLAIYESEGDAGLELLRSIGYQPNFYGVRNVKSTMKIAMQFSAETTETATSTPSLRSSHMAYAMPVNATTQNKYGFSGTASTELTFEIVPLPPQNAIRRVPELRHKTVEEARIALARSGLQARFVDSQGVVVDATSDSARKITAQKPDPYEIVALDEPLTLTVA